MKSIHLVTTALTGGGTGKSTFSSMLAAYLCRPQSPKNIVAVLDTSHNARLYQRLRNLFNNPLEEFVAQQNCFSIQEQDRTLIVIRSGSENIENGNALAALVDAIYSDFYFDHLICETNLVTNRSNSRAFFNTLRGGRHAVTPLYMWTTWKTEAVTDPEEYKRYQNLVGSIASEVTWNYIHNPYTANTGQPEDALSQGMYDCHCLPLSNPISPTELWTYCGNPAREAINQGKTYDEMWTEAYRQFLEQKMRPRNVLPVFQRSKGWESATLLQFDVVNSKISAPSQLADTLEKISDGMYSNVFEKYFMDVNL